jgi:putative aminopeptidase FrvX
VRFLAIVFAGLAAALAGETIQYDTLNRALIEERLRSFGSTNEAREQIIRDLFLKAGCPSENLQEMPVKHVRAPNLFCSLPGQSDSAIMVGAHFDFVPAGKGVIDNWSGVSLLPSLLESINKVSRRHRFVFAAFTNEEEGLIGSRAYVRGLSKEQLHAISAMINIDSLAAGSTKVELDRGDKQLVLALDAIATTLHLPLSVVNVHKVGRSDSDTFQDAGVPTIMVHSITQETLPILHSMRDRMEAVRLDDYYDSYKLLAAYLAYLDGKLDPPGTKYE